MSQVFNLGQRSNRPANELIFLTKSEHRRLHRKGKPVLNKGQAPWNKNKKMSDEYREKCRKAHKNISNETRKKMSEAHKGKTPWNKGKKGIQTAWNKGIKCGSHSEEHKKKMSDALKGRHWYNNGKINKFCYECPPGFVPGMLR